MSTFHEERSHPATSRRRSQAQRSEETVSALLHAARELFARDGYAATPLDRIAAEAGVTKGALYHHFAGKQELFRSVYEGELERLMSIVGEKASGHERAWDALRAACEAFLDASLDPAIQRITLLDAATVLGWETVRQIENETSLHLLKEGLRRSMQEGSIASREVGPLASLLFGAMCEAAMTIARTPDQPENARRTHEELGRLLHGIACE